MIKARRRDEFINAQGGEGNMWGSNLRINEQDEDFTRRWYWDICGDKNFEENYQEFMGAPATVDEPPPGSNRRILAAFYNSPDDHKRMNSMYLLELYHHKACGDRADSENWYWRLAFLVGLVGLAIVLLVGFLQRFVAEELDWLAWLILAFFLMDVVVGIAFYEWGDKIVGCLKNRRKDERR